MFMERAAQIDDSKQNPKLLPDSLYKPGESSDQMADLSSVPQVSPQFVEPISGNPSVVPQSLSQVNYATTTTTSLIAARLNVSPETFGSSSNANNNSGVLGAPLRDAPDHGVELSTSRREIAEVGEECGQGDPVIPEPREDSFQNQDDPVRPKTGEAPRQDQSDLVIPESGETPRQGQGNPVIPESGEAPRQDQNDPVIPEPSEAPPAQSGGCCPRPSFSRCTIA